MPVIATPTKMPSFDALRLALPTQAFVRMLSQIALTGTMPILDMDGNPTNEAQACSPQMRYDALKYLTDKTIPQAKATDVQGTTSIEEIARKSQVLRALPIEELIKLRDEAQSKITANALTQS